MGDSDDDREFKRRDKFHTERRGHDGGERFGGGEWREARPGPPPGYGGGGGFRGRPMYGGDFRRDRYSPERGGGRRHEMSPPPKRMRGGWEDDRYGGGYEGGGYDREYDRPPPRHFNRGAKPKEEDLEGFQPAMMSFKAFLQTQDDQISDEDAIKKYAEYKLEFKRQQLNEFFVTHKDEEWFKQKYHPDDSVKRKDELRDMLKKRVEVFQEFMEQSKFAELTLDGDKQDALIKVLDSVVIKLEGGTDFDITVLDLPDPEEEQKKEDSKKKKDEIGEKKDPTPSNDAFDDENAELMKKAKEFLNFMDPAEEKSNKDEESRKRKREENDDDQGESEDKEPKDPSEESGKTPTKTGDLDSVSDGEDSAMKDEEKSVEKPSVEEEDKEEKEETPKPRALHKTSSIFLRNLAPTITKLEVEAMCKRFDGFLRSAIADPAPDRRWFRRGWVTFKRDVKIKDICFNLNNIRLRDCELGPIVNRDLTRRIRTVAGLTQDKKVVRNDIKLAAKIITNLDGKWGLWKAEEEGKKEEVMLGLASSNPLLANITDYLIEEASAEEEELLGRRDGEDEEGGEEGVNIQRDEELITVLDKMILYLRIVHSVDFYNHSEYPNEDEMPNRCGILHARGIVPATKVTSSEVEEYMTTFEKKMGGFLVMRGDLTDEEASKYGLKNETDEVEKFVSANTQELGKDKWLCPLSGKKFKGPDFVRKHILQKHIEKVDEVKKEVNYFNNYLKDPKRPQLPEHPTNKTSSGRPSAPDQGPRGGDPYQYSGPPRDITRNPVYGRDRGGWDDRGDRGGGGRYGPPPPRRDAFAPSRPRGGDGFSGRPIITYRDWDAPNDDYF